MTCNQEITKEKKCCRTRGGREGGKEGRTVGRKGGGLQRVGGGGGEREGVGR